MLGFRLRQRLWLLAADNGLASNTGSLARSLWMCRSRSKTHLPSALERTCQMWELGLFSLPSMRIVRKWQKESAVPGSNRRRQDYWWIRPSKSYGLPLSQPRFDVSESLLILFTLLARRKRPRTAVGIVLLYSSWPVFQLTRPRPVMPEYSLATFNVPHSHLQNIMLMEDTSNHAAIVPSAS
jgi:hypothetical protein